MLTLSRLSINPCEHIYILGSFHFDISEKVGKEESDKGKRKALSDSEKEEEEEEEQEKSVTKKRKLRSRSVCRNDNEEEPAGPSSQLTPRKRSKKLCFCKSSPQLSSYLCRHGRLLNA